ncbi:MAG TPA: hypothetical protein DCQ50_21480 [Chryseobacterium sp.]|nr:hypothetical protein [Chryseobacterium sp.]
MKKVIVWLALIFSFCKLNGQDLKRVPLSKAEKKKNILAKYLYSEKGSYGVIILVLYTNGSFEYSMYSFRQDVISFGKWKIKQGILVLNSTITKDNLPIRIDYSSDTTNRINQCKFNIIKNSAGIEVSDAFVLINNDTTRCLPSYASCYGRYTTIDSVKILIENGITSKWVKLKTDLGQSQINITIDMNMLPSKYYVIENGKYKMVGDRLVETGL